MSLMTKTQIELRKLDIVIFGLVKSDIVNHDSQVIMTLLSLHYARGKKDMLLL
jgi:hypothetical protein